MRLTRFVINGWPPLASHLGFLMLGCGLSALSPAAGPAVPIPGSILVRIKATPAAVEWQVGLRLDAVEPNQGRCRLNRAPVVVAAMVPSPLLGFDRADFSLAVETVRSVRRKVAFHAVKAKRLPACGKGPVVKYAR